MRQIANEREVDRDELLDFIGERHQWILATTKLDSRPQMSPVTGGVTTDGRLVIATYPFRNKALNVSANPLVSVCVLSDHFGGPWVQVDGRAAVTYMPDALEPLVEYFRAVSGEHPNWDEYREAMTRQEKCLISIEVNRWGPIALGGFPASVIPLLSELDEDDTAEDNAEAPGDSGEET